MPSTLPRMRRIVSVARRDLGRHRRAPRVELGQRRRLHHGRDVGLRVEGLRVDRLRGGRGRRTGGGVAAAGAVVGRQERAHAARFLVGVGHRCATIELELGHLVARRRRPARDRVRARSRRRRFAESARARRPARRRVSRSDPRGGVGR
eukprot:31126-Pelagococcus_subviridis.AAC.8